MLVDDSSRIARDIADAIRVMQTLKFLGIRVIYISQGETPTRTRRMLWWQCMP